MNDKKKRIIRSSILTLCFIITLIPTIIFNSKMRNEHVDYEEVKVKVTDIKMGVGLFNTPKMTVTVRYDGEDHTLGGVSSADHNQLKTAKLFARTSTRAYLHDGNLYLHENTIKTPITKQYYTFLAVAFVMFWAAVFSWICNTNPKIKV